MLTDSIQFPCRDSPGQVVSTNSTHLDYYKHHNLDVFFSKNTILLSKASVLLSAGTELGFFLSSWYSAVFWSQCKNNGDVTLKSWLLLHYADLSQRLLNVSCSASEEGRHSRF